MTSLLKTAALTITALFALVTTAQATVVIDFAGIPNGGTYAEDGFVITDTYNAMGIRTWGNPGPSLSKGVTVNQMTLVDSNGALFDVTSIDMIGLQSSPIERFIGTLASGGTVTQDFNWTNYGFQTYSFNSTFTNLTSLTWFALHNNFVYDNIVLEYSAALPIPGAALLLGFGLVGVAAARKRAP